ncbi:ELWxxDGT repeat protein [Flavobacterium sp. RHBU_24]|uniref:ELWxxDGT repeat protein n=1 Tax=Flavobacterium sp. RHBU_24 TaxID=3391185 RepID=UPI0039846FD5
MKKILYLFLIISCITASSAQNIDATLLETNFVGDSYPMDMTALGDKIGFTSLNINYQRSLRFYNPATNSMYTEGYQTDAANLNVVADNLFFTSSSNSKELWKTDGTPENTVLVKDLGESGYFGEFIVYDSKLYFTFTNHNYNNIRQIWVSDGTEAGTHVLKNLNTVPFNDDTSNLFVFNGSLYFSGKTPEAGYELWKSDGTESGTVLFADIAPGTANAGPQKPIIFGNNFYFVAATPTAGAELWKSDGTAEGTTLFKEFVTGANGISVYTDLSGIVVSDEYFIFMVNYGASNRLWKSNGTPEGTTQLKIINYPAENFTTFSNFTLLNNTPYFIASDYFGSGTQIWTTDGTVDGTVVAVDTVLANAGSITLLTAADDYLIFKASGMQSYNPKPWITDGTQQGTHLLKDINIEGTSAGNFAFVHIGDKVYFPGGYESANGVELWYTDGTEQGTAMTPDIRHSYSGTLSGPGRFSSSIFNGSLIFAGNNGLSGTEPFISNGTAAGTHVIKDVNPGENISFGFTNQHENYLFIKAGNKLFFNGYGDGTGAEIFVTDGTGQGTKLVKDIMPGIGSSVTGNTYFMAFDDVFYFKANDNIHGNELWRTDGSEEGTWLVKDINPGSESGVNASNSLRMQNKNYTVYNGSLFFVANDGTGEAVWKTNGTAESTLKVITLPATNAYPVIIAANNNKIFITTTGLNVLYGSDGTQEGTVLIQSDINSNYIHFLHNTLVNDELYYNVNTNTTGRSIFRSDGTLAGTVLVKGDLATDRGIKFMQSCGNTIFFGLGANDWLSWSSDQIWKTDGTANGTIMLTQSDTNSFQDYTCIQSNLMFVNPTSTPNLWISDGTVLNTYSVDVTVSNGTQFEEYYGINSIFGVIDNKIYMGANTLNSGHELYVANAESILSAPSTVDLHNDKRKNDITLYPNPSNGWVTIYSKSNSVIYGVEIYDLAGKKLFGTDVNDTKYELQANDMANGIYLVKVKSSNGTETQKLIRS